MRRLPFIGALIIVAGIATLVIFFQHRHPWLRCCLDGSRIEPMYEVIIIQKDKSCKFSCVLSAQIWLTENSEQVSSIRVTDEITGEKIEAKDAYYVVSKVITTPHTGNKIHVFAKETAAKVHARQFNGQLVRNPLRTHQKKPVKMVTYKPDSPNSTDFISSPFQKLLSLPSNTVLIKEQDFIYIYQNHFTRLCRGYSSPPDKPPKNSFQHLSGIHKLVLFYGTKNADFYYLA